MIRPVLGAVALAVAVTACGGDGKTGAASRNPGSSTSPSSPSSPESPTAAPSATTTAAPTSSATGGRPSSTAKPAATTAAPSYPSSGKESWQPPPPTPTNLPSKAPLTVRLKFDCVTRGQTQQVIMDTVPKAHIAYNNPYSDGREGSVHGGMDGQARADGKGHFEATWLIGPAAPVGWVRLDIAASSTDGSGGTIKMLYYKLAKSC